MARGESRVKRLMGSWRVVSVDGPDILLCVFECVRLLQSDSGCTGYVWCQDVRECIGRQCTHSEQRCN